MHRPARVDEGIRCGGAINRQARRQSNADRRAVAGGSFMTNPTMAARHTGDRGEKTRLRPMAGTMLPWRLTRCLAQIRRYVVEC
jgi:hypothetical protein